jgi:hypothetical protein
MIISVARRQHALCASFMNTRLCSSSLLDASAFSKDFERPPPDTHNWNSPHCFRNTSFCSMKRQNVTLHHPSNMNHYGLGIHTILSSTLSLHIVDCTHLWFQFTQKHNHDSRNQDSSKQNLHFHVHIQLKSKYYRP